MVYFIQGRRTGLVKIGKTSNLCNRLGGMQVNSPDRLTVLAVIENANDDYPYHVQFVDDWEFGEWFKPSDALLAFIASLHVSKYAGMVAELAHAHMQHAAGRYREQQTGKTRCYRCGCPLKDAQQDGYCKDCRDARTILKATVIKADSEVRRIIDDMRDDSTAHFTPNQPVANHVVRSVKGKARTKGLVRQDTHPIPVDSAGADTSQHVTVDSLLKQWRAVEAAMRA